MGSYAEYWLGPLYIGATKYDVDDGLMRFFRPADKHVLQGKLGTLPFQMRKWAKYVEQEDDVTVVFYQCSGNALRSRLELRGYSREMAKKAFEMGLQAEIDHYSSYDDSYKEMFGPTNPLESIDVEQWLAALRVIRSEGLELIRWGNDAKEYEGTLIGYMLKNDWYGCPTPDVNVAIRLMLDVCPENDDFIYDLTDIISSGGFSADEDFVAYSLARSFNDNSAAAKTIVLTEGRSDSWIISESLKLLYPDVSEYFTFMDFETARIAGGASGLANIVKAFAAAGIVNRVTAIFDNDTAGEVAVRSLRHTPLPRNIRILKLPVFEPLREYPTIGPTGLNSMDVNGIAGSIELYLGADVLSDERGTLIPVQWTGFEAGLKKYQGEVLSKSVIQERFGRRLQACQEDPSLLSKTDWTGIRTILSAIVDAFKDADANDILSSLAQHHAADD